MVLPMNEKELIGKFIRRSTTNASGEVTPPR